MKFLLSAFVLMMMLSVSGCSDDNACESAVTTGDVEVEDVQVDAVEETTASDVVVDSTEDVATVEEGD
jgi:hypothetical protein